MWIGAALISRPDWTHVPIGRKLRRPDSPVLGPKDEKEQLPSGPEKKGDEELLEGSTGKNFCYEILSCSETSCVNTVFFICYIISIFSCASFLFHFASKSASLTLTFFFKLIIIFLFAQKVISTRKIFFSDLIQKYSI